MRCPRCKLEIEPRPEGGAPGGPLPLAKGPSFCPGCGAPLRLAEEPPPGPLDGPLSIDRRGAALDLDETRPGVMPAHLAPPRAAGPAEAPLRQELADVERSHWEIGKPSGAGRSGPAGGAEGAKGAGPETWSGRRASGGSPPPLPAAGARPDPRPAQGAPARAARPGTDPAPAAAPGAESPPPRREAGRARGAETGVEPVAAPIVEVRVRRAEGWRRASAWAVDGIPFAAAGALVLRWTLREAAIASTPGSGLVDLATREPAIVGSVAGAVVLALAVYGTLAHFLAGATLGKRILGIRVVGPDGARPSLGRSAVRSGLALVSAGMLGMGILLALFTRSGRGLHDLVARTWVVRAP